MVYLFRFQFWNVRKERIYRMSTIKLYDDQPYGKEFQAEVLSCEPVRKNGRDAFAVVLDQTLFFPEEGGQSPDTGKLGGADVFYVSIDKEQVITHFTDKPLEAGSHVKGVIDWPQRFSNMQNHTGEHILSGLIHKYYGYNNVGFHLSPDIVTMDMDGVVSPEGLKKIEQEANRAVYENVEVICSYPEKEVLSALDYRSKIEIDGPVRIVEVKGYDICACCAPHVARAGEIGLIKILKSENYKGGIRLTIASGSRALAAVQEVWDAAQDAARELSVKPEEIAPAVKKVQDDVFALRGKLAAFQMQAVRQKAEAVPEGQKNAWFFEEELDTKAQRDFVNLLTAKCSGYAGVFVGNDADGYKYIIGSAGGDARVPNQALREEFKARGGGKPEMVQGSVNAPKADILAAFEQQ